MQSKSKANFIVALGFLAILLSSFVFNVSIGALMVSTAALIILKFSMDALPGSTLMDSFITQSVENLEILPEAVEHWEESVHDTINLTREKVSKAWSHHHAEVELIASELSQINCETLL